MISQSFAQESQPLKWQAAYGFNGAIGKAGSSSVNIQNHQLSYGVYKDINKRWYWNADLQLGLMKYKNTSFYFQSIDTNGAMSYDIGTFDVTTIGLGLTYRVGYKFIAREKFSASFFLGLNAVTNIYSQSKSSILSPYSYASSTNSFSGLGLSFLGGLQAEYKLKNNSSLYLSYELNNFQNTSYFSNNFGLLQFGYRKAFKN